MMAQHIDTFGTPKPLGADLTLAIISLGLIFIAKPLVAQTFPAETTSGRQQTTIHSAGQNSAVPTKSGAVPSSPAMESTAATRSYINPIIAPVPDTAVTPGSSQSQRSANAEQNNTNNILQVQPLPECKVDDSVCIELRNKQNGLNPQTAPAFIR